ncbi:MAG: glycosyltransferase family 4 protein, partial [Halodesulfurarchaeum sp.]
MRVALVSATTVHHQSVDGAERLNRLATLLDQRGHDVTVLSAQWWEGEPATFERDGVTYRAVTRTPDDWQFPYRLPVAIRRARPEVVHSVCQPPGHMIGARIGATLAGAPLVVECYDPPMARSRLASRLYAIGGRSADAVVTPSRTVKTRVREFGVAPEDIHAIPTGIDM